MVGRVVERVDEVLAIGLEQLRHVNALRSLDHAAECSNRGLRGEPLGLDTLVPSHALRSVHVR